MTDDNIIPLTNPDEVMDEVVSDAYEEGYAEGLKYVDELNAELTREYGEADNDFIDGLYDAIVENLDI